jgi:hypothetical protein
VEEIEGWREALGAGSMRAIWIACWRRCEVLGGRCERRLRRMMVGARIIEEIYTALIE